MLPLQRYRLRKPQLVPLLFIIAATALLAGLGVWQLQRLSWKEAIVAKAEDAAKEPPISTLPKDLEQAHNYVYRHATLEGRFISEYPLRIHASRKGVYGYNYLLPFMENAGGMVLVDLGFVPQQSGELVLALQKNVVIEGIFIEPRQRRFFSPPNDAEKNLWFYHDIPAMQKSFGIDEHLRFFPLIFSSTEALPGQASAYPRPHEEAILFRNDHLGYAITWFLLAIVGLGLFTVFHLEKK